MLGGCAPKASDDPSLAQLQAVSHYLSSPRHLRNSAYSATRASGKPSELVSFLFSDLGVAEWPPAIDASAGEQEQMRAAGIPMFPLDAALVYDRPDPRLGKQLVLSGDDGSNEIVATAYLDPRQAPIAIERWAMPEFRER